MSHPRDEVEAAVVAYIATRDRIGAGDGEWADLAPHFTDDAVFVDPAWGRCEGLAEMRETVFGPAMAGLEGWTFPTDFYLIDGDVAVVKWRQVIPGTDGHDHVQSGISTMIYAGDGRFRYAEDLLNMTHVMEGIVASGYQPPDGKPWPTPPPDPDRDFSIPGDR
ncbi:hypothetical protein BH24ACT4_BH24ACT4_26650 [soil metagenome]